MTQEEIITQISNNVIEVKTRVEDILKRQREDHEARVLCRQHCDQEMPQVYKRINEVKSETDEKIVSVRDKVIHLAGARAEQTRIDGTGPHKDTANWTRLLAVATFAMVLLMVFVEFYRAIR